MITYIFITIYILIFNNINKKMENIYECVNLNLIFWLQLNDTDDL